MQHPKGIIALPLAFVLVAVALLAAGGSWWYAQSKKEVAVNVNAGVVVNTNTDVTVNTNTTANTNVATNSNTSANANTNTAVSANFVQPTQFFYLHNGDVWLANADGSQPLQITKKGNIEEYYWIPKTHVLFFYAIDREIQGGAKVIMKNLDTNAEETIYSITENFGAGPNEIGPNLTFHLSPSNDGSKVAISGDFIQSPSKDAIVYNVTTKTQQKINTNANPAVISPDGKSLTWSDDNNMYVVSLADLAKKQITHNQSVNALYNTNYSAWENTPYIQEVVGWSPSSEKIFYLYGDLGHGGTQSLRLFEINPDTSITKQATDSNAGAQDFLLDQSSDGRYLYYQINNRPLSNWALKRIDLSSGAITTIQPSVVANTNANFELSVFGFSQSPGTLVFAPGIGNGDSTIFTMQLDGTGNRKVVDDASDPKWKF